MACRTAAQTGVLLAISLSLAACTGREGAARDTFEQAFLCPAERITSVKIESMSWPELEQRISPKKAPMPSVEIRDDPARLAVWQKQQDEYAHSRQVFDTRWDTRKDVYRVSGCGHEAIYACHFSTPQRGLWRGHCQSTPASALDILRDVQ